MKLKKLFAISLAVIITGVLSPISQNMSDNAVMTAHAEPDDRNEDEIRSIFSNELLKNDDNTIEYVRRYEKGEITLRNCDSSASGKIDIPAIIDGWPVTRIGICAFEHCKEITSVTIPDSVKSIGSQAFLDCTSLKSVSIGNNVETIERSAFSSCSSLEKVVVPNSVSAIDELAFSKCSNLKSIELSNNITTIESCTFEWCSNLKSIKIPPSVTTIKGMAFYWCKSLESLECGENVSKFYLSAIMGCESMKYLTLKNPKCEISLEYLGDTLTSELLKRTGPQIDNIVIQGYKNSTAETVAKQYGFKFSPLPSYGDPNEDGKINSVDASEILSLYAKNTLNKTKPSSDDIARCDINKDRAVNAVDASYVLSYYAYTATNKTPVSLTDYMKKK